MKRLFTIILFSIMLFSIQAQQSDNVTLNIILRPIQNITVNTLQKSVDLVYDSAEKYESGTTSRQTEHLEIFSSGGFAVQVSGTSFEMDGDIKIIADPVQPNPTYSFTSVDLSQTPTDLIVGGRGGRQKFNVTYDNSGGANKYFDKEHKTYTSEITYTIISR